ncbi:hypothetical protein BsWGS_09536 [Bradybaena similaris]
MQISSSTFFVALLACVLVTGEARDNQTHKASESCEGRAECGRPNPNNNVIDLSEPDRPGPFHDLTTAELKKLREFLEKDPDIRAEKSSNASVSSSYIFTADAFMPKKSDVLNYLSGNGPQPERRARVIMFRGDKSPAVVEEYVCGPLPEVSRCDLLNLTSFRNPIQFSVRPLNGIELMTLETVILREVDRKVGYILKESYGETFTQCEQKGECLKSAISPVGTGIIDDIDKRLVWLNAVYDLQYSSVYFLDFSVLVECHSSDPTKWTIWKVWYNDQIFDSLDDLISHYNNNSIAKTKVTKPVNNDNLFSKLKLRGEPMPPKPQRPPVLAEPDGKRFSVKHKKVTYMGWSFHYRLSPLFGPSLYNIEFNGERVVYEIGLADIAVFYSGHAPFSQTSDYVDSGVMLGSRSKALVPGADCPETATLLSATFMSQYSEEPAVYKAAMCLFEDNDGNPLRRHLSYDIKSGAFYGGVPNTALVLRTIMAISNYDYAVDFHFHKSGAVTIQFMSTGYIQTSYFSPLEKPYGHHIQDFALGNLHQHVANFKVDLDVGGSSNRYETVELGKENLKSTAFPDRMYSQTKITSTLKKTEQEAIYDFDLETPINHLVYNNDKRNAYNESKAYRIIMKGISKTLVEEGSGNEQTMSWTRHQMVVTKRKDDEISSSSIYGMFDSHYPVSNFTSYYADNENIEDEDLVFWLTGGLHHIPHTEDFPVTPTVGNHLTFHLVPNNFFPECPSMSSRDAIFIEHKDPKDPTKGVKVDRNGNSRDEFVLPRSTLEEDLEADPDRILESRRPNPTDF